MVKKTTALDLAAPMSLGCIGCSVLEDCGGHYSPKGGWGCSDRLHSPDDPNDVLSIHERNYPQRVAEIGGFGFGDLDRIGNPTHLPPYVSGIDHGSYLTHHDAKHLKWAAVHLRKVISFPKGRWRPRFRSPAELRRHFGIRGNTKLMLTCIDKDRSIEPLWAQIYEPGLSRYLASLGFDAAVAPNFSVFDNDPPAQHQYNRKRSAIVAEEFSRFGLPTVLYCHGNRPTDWEFWRDFLRSHPELSFIAKEFQTGLASPARGRACIRALASLQDAVERPLHIVVFGATRHRRYIADRFRNWTLVSFSPFVLSTKRRELVAHKNGFREQWAKDERPGLLFSRSHQLLHADCTSLHATRSAQIAFASARRRTGASGDADVSPTSSPNTTTTTYQDRPKRRYRRSKKQPGEPRVGK
ncbi:hypothetical protein ENSA5_38510 [Enhygromyxa salina]|uniref:Uncharacterized protein n=1 Tax=Enhygromyxa salina TaxID=215803 RepID=A0A2S9XRK4_9BACT|nr:hypothetical protein ENSA5_38510 [Enhygromyxa salina]